MDVQENQSNINSIMKELSDIKASLAVNTSETANIKLSVGEIKGDIKEIKNDFVNRKELTDALALVDGKYKGIKEEIAPLKKSIYGLIGTVGLTVLGAIMKTILK